MYRIPTVNEKAMFQRGNDLGEHDLLQWKVIHITTNKNAQNAFYHVHRTQRWS